jgi:adenosylcobinamide amidohydrolase
MVEVINVDGDVILKLGTSHRALSSTVDGGIRNNIMYVIHHKVPKNFNEDPYREITKVHRKYAINSNNAITFLTATELPKNHTIHREISNDIETLVSITIGLSNPYRINQGNIEFQESINTSTINIAVIINKPLSIQAMIDIITLTAQTKTITLIELTDNKIHGTTSDAIAILTPADGKPIPYAGPATEIGKALVHAIHNALVKIYNTYINT